MLFTVFIHLVVILGRFENSYIFFVSQATICCAKGPLRVQQYASRILKTTTSINMHANWHWNPLVRLREVFSKDYFLHPPTPSFPRIWPNGRYNASPGAESYHNVRVPPSLIKARGGQHGWVQMHHVGLNRSLSLHKYAISFFCWLPTTKSTTMTSNDSPLLQ